MKSTALALLFLLSSPAPAGQSPLHIDFGGKYGQVEVGGPYAGAEFHRSMPLPSRISFYEPAANSIDMSTDYWTRGESAPFGVAVRVNGGAPLVIGREPWAYALWPHRVEFRAEESGLRWTFRWEFFKTLPGLLWTLTCENPGTGTLRLEITAGCRTILRTCQTYAWLDSAWTEEDASRHAIAVHFDQTSTRRATIVLQNLAASPAKWTSVPERDDSARTGGLFESRGGATRPRGHRGSTIAAFLYRARLAHAGRIVVRLAIFSSGPGTWRSDARRARAHWREDAASYDGYIRAQTALAPVTGDSSLDRTADWACALLAADAHSLEGRIVPMPCPAEYNFFFTHDLLLTDLSAVWLDARRVRRDILYVASLAQDSTIPHARYWRDSRFTTELCTTDNWNHFWFLEVVTRYLHHTGDTATVARLFPLVRGSLRAILSRVRSDSLMDAFRPDWWDIGRREGPRAYTTILGIRALRDFCFLGAALGRDRARLPGYERLAGGMERALGARLWDDRVSYLMNYNGDELDGHYYMGSLMGAVYAEIPRDRAERLLATAGKELLDPKIGVRNVAPVDFNTDSLRAYWHFPTNEAGDPYRYANGGVWAHANCWYAEGLVRAGQCAGALEFVKTAMTLDGVMSSPRGQPAFYEYRYADAAAPDYGAIDKPAFLWSAGMYLGALESLLGLEESPWNISCGDGTAPAPVPRARLRIQFGGSKNVRLKGTGGPFVSIAAGGASSPSAVVPLDAVRHGVWSIRRAEGGSPCLASIDAILCDCRAVPHRGLRARCSSFDGHAVHVRVVSDSPLVRATLDGRSLRAVVASRSGSTIVTSLEFPGSSRLQTLTVETE